MPNKYFFHARYQKVLIRCNSNLARKNRKGSFKVVQQIFNGNNDTIGTADVLSIKASKLSDFQVLKSIYLEDFNGRTDS